MAVRESPEIAAVVVSIGEAWGRRDFETYSSLISNGPHFRGIGTDADEFWDSTEKFLKVRRVQVEELDEQGWVQAEATLERVEAFEDGPIGWALMLYTLRTPIGDVDLRATAVLALEAGTWRVVQWHTSVPSPNVHTFGIELTTTLDELLNSVAEDDEALALLANTGDTSTLVFTDIVGSTTLAEEVGDDRWVQLVAEHEKDIRRAATEHQGRLVKMLGDGSMLSFPSARAAVRTAIDIQAAARSKEYSVRIGVHSGEVVRRQGDLLGTTVNKAARVASVAEGGQILVSSVVAELVGTGEGFGFGRRQTVNLKGLSGTHTLMPVELAASHSR